MKVVCRSRSYSQCHPNGYYARLVQPGEMVEFDLDVGKTYVVFGIAFREADPDAPFYYLCGEDNDAYPLRYPARLFELVDHSLPAFWGMFQKALSDSTIIWNIIPKEWGNIPDFHAELLEGDVACAEIWYRYRSLMEAESP